MNHFYLILLPILAACGNEQKTFSYKPEDAPKELCNTLFPSSVYEDDNEYDNYNDGYYDNYYDDYYYEEEKITGRHNQGKPCLSCHSSGEYVFEGGGTVFRKIDSPDGAFKDAAEGYTVELITESCKKIRAFRGYGSGNFYFTYFPSEKFFPLVVDPSGKTVNRSSAPHTPDRKDCNSCHTSHGQNGAPGRIVSYDWANSLSGER